MRLGKEILATCLFLDFLLSLVPTGTNSSAQAMGQGIKIMTYNVMDDVVSNEVGSFSYDSPANREDAIFTFQFPYVELFPILDQTP